MLKRMLLGVVMVLVVLCAVAVWAKAPKNAATPAAQAKKTAWTLVDQVDHKVTVKIPVERMVVMQHHSIDILRQLGAQDRIVAVEKNWAADLGGYIRAFPFSF